MKKNLTELVIIIDKSGSMGGLENDVIGGYNTLIKEQAKDEGEVLVTTLLFDNDLKYVNQRVNISEIKPMTNKDYIPSGCTALLDAVGSAIGLIKTKHMGLTEEERPEHTIFSIMTDGYENASREYDYKQIKNMIENQKKEGWDFLFQAANIDERAEGARLGIDAEDIARMDCSVDGMKYCFASASLNIKAKKSKPTK